MIIESCVETLEEAISAQNKGADRLELCSHLELDGLSPGIQLVEKVLKKVSIPVKLMVRLRSGSFIYNEEELESMIEYCYKFSSFPIDGFVVGMLKEYGVIDVDSLTCLLSEFPYHQFTFHKAIDLVDDPIQEIRKCDHLKNLTHILTSGKQATAMEGIPLIHKMVSSLEPRFKIIAAGKITPENLTPIKKATKATEFHGRNIV